MGMDIYGSHPSNEAGEYFRASIWSWPPILSLVRTANQVFNLSYDTAGWEMNDGCGLDNQEDCSILADAMQRLLHSAESPVLTAEHGGMAKAMSAAFGSNIGVKPQAETSKEHVQRFIDFLRGCGGFRIC
jgi:hypothetical protein